VNHREQIWIARAEAVILDEMARKSNMHFDPNTHHQRSIRLKGYYYFAASGYFVTIVALRRECLFGEIEDGEMRLNDLGDRAGGMVPFGMLTKKTPLLR